MTADPSPPEDRRPPERRATTSGDGGGLSWADAVGLAPAVLRTGLLAGQRFLTWTTASTMFVTRSAAETVGGVRTPADLVGAARDGVVGALREALGVADLEAELQRLTGQPGPGAPSGSGTPTPGAVAPVGRSADGPAVAEPDVPGPDGDGPGGDGPDGDGPDGDDAGDDVPISIEEAGPERVDLRDRGRQLLARSSTLEPDEEHPAFGLVLEQVAPDEMRILRVLVREGDQAAVDVETSGVLGGRGPVVARRVSLVADVAGCKHPDRLPVYLDNLVRLGVVRVGDEPLGDGAYEVIEAQPRVDEARAEASRGASRARVTRRRLELSDFGKAFCAGCLPDE